MPRFFIESDKIKNSIAIIDGKDVKHIRRVLRLGVGDHIILFDDTYMEYHAVIIDGNSKEIKAKILNNYLAKREPTIEVILGQGLPRLSKMDIIVQKGTELGVSKILPFNSHRSIPRLTNEKTAKKVKRWQKIALEAAKQCGRNSTPYIALPVDFSKILTDDFEDGLKLILWEEEKTFSLRYVLNNNANLKRFFVLVGPEGGFVETEIEDAQKKGFHVVSMGARTLRTETASMSILTIIQHRFGDLN
ncbi:MAG: 16S rRNA (uracil(1498)-N(3))-methyltransferase [Thermodesulfobacteriota bacterium]|nr:16S rRNA (uracil(1498)-N(3))-methyltransferase [Thermodesulfobacteriota bacterium]